MMINNDYFKCKDSQSKLDNYLFVINNLSR